MAHYLAGDEVEIRYAATYRGVEFVRTNGIDKVRLGHGLLPSGLERLLVTEMGINSTGR